MSRIFSFFSLASVRVPLNSIKNSQLTKSMNKNVCFWLSPNLCTTIFKSSSGSFSDYEVEKLKDFISSSKNIRHRDTNNVKKCENACMPKENNTNDSR